jgi:hypothetical protein
MRPSGDSSLRTCDIVMKGGITSGVVYPKAIVTLAKRFRFINLGGTSAGAIAAAATAAAEYRRTVKGCSGGFEQLGKLGDYLGEIPKGENRTRLFSLFRPNAGSQRIYGILTDMLGIGRSGVGAVLGRSLGKYPGAAFLGLLPGALLVFLSLPHVCNAPIAWLWSILGVGTAVAGAVLAAAVAMAREFMREVPRNNFGLCNGMDDDAFQDSGASEPLTIWLTRYLNEVAGKNPGERPLTFGDLWGPPENHADEHLRAVKLEVMTTNLTHGRPYRLPFRDDEDLSENHLFFFREDEFRRLFPKTVVDWMLSKPRPISTDSEKELASRNKKRAARAKRGFYPMPAPADLPVVVATRMSLSFPILLSAIPLHCVDYSQKEKKFLPERCWFTDGGLCSNFPLHFFDSPLPRRPTFSIDLTEKPDDTPDAELLPEMDDNNGGNPIDRWNRFDLRVSADTSKSPVEKSDLGKLIGFFATMISTMQNWNDATVGRLPGYRDRIARIPLTSRQGGLNLDMPPELIGFLTNQGEKCAEVLMQHFDVPSDPAANPMTWENHRWIRLRSLLAAMERMNEQILRTCDQPENGDERYDAWLERLLASNHSFPDVPGYPAHQNQIRAALETLRHLRELEQLWNAAGTAAKKAPKPRPALRPRPQI